MHINNEQSYINQNYQNTNYNSSNNNGKQFILVILLKVIPIFLLLAAIVAWLLSVISWLLSLVISLIMLILNITYSIIIGKNEAVTIAKVISIIGILCGIGGFVLTTVINLGKDNIVSVNNGYEVAIDGEIIKLNDAYGNNIDTLDFNINPKDYIMHVDRVVADGYNYIQYYYMESEDIIIKYTIHNPGTTDCRIRDCEILGVEIYSLSKDNLLNYALTFNFGYGVTSANSVSEIISTLAELDADYYYDVSETGEKHYEFSVYENNIKSIFDIRVKGSRLVDISILTYTD